MRVIVAGGGIGGLTTAIALRELGLEAGMRAFGTKPQSYDYRDLRTGKMLYQAPLGDEAAGRYGAPMYNVHRADLIQLLFDAVPPEAKARRALRRRVPGQGRRRGDAADRREGPRRCAGRLRRNPFGGAQASARRGREAFCQHPDVAFADPGRAARRPQPG